MVTIADVITYKRLVACGNDIVYFEDVDVSAGTMTELSPSNGDIDTSDQLTMFEGYQKVFVVNGTKLKVADFINIKIYDDSGFTNEPVKGDIVYQAGTSAAKILVDYIDSTNKFLYGYVMSGIVQVATAITTVVGGEGDVIFPSPTDITGELTHAVLTTAHAATDVLTQGSATMTVEYTNAAKTRTYGRITAGTFNTTNEVTGSGDGTAFTPTTTDTSPPLWYDWTVYPGGASGTMPSSAYLGCLYRGRCVVAGDPNYPHQWYMSKVGDPWSWNYDSTDPLSAVRGGNADAGEVGDIIRCLIPYKDDFLIIGCANTIWVMMGDPTAGGSLNEVDLTVGMFGANSWCFDGNGNLYFWGTNGFYMIPRGFGAIVNLTEMALPKIVIDEEIDPSVHRITMEYDRKRAGILISITKLSDGTNSCYWYDLKLKGFYPETYPEECGAYSILHYDANDDEYKDLLVGCKDGYIRKFDDSQKDDDIGDTNEAISSYCTIIQQIAKDSESEGKLTSLTAITAGGASGGAFGDTDSVSYSMYRGDNAELVLENIRNGAAAFATGTWSGAGKQNKVRQRMRGTWVGIKLANSTANQTWSLEKLFGNIEPAGRI